MTAAPMDSAFGAEWASDWPDTMTLREAAEEFDFDLWDKDDDALPLVKTLLPLSELTQMTPAQASATLAAYDANDAEDRTGRLDVGLSSGGRLVPPVIVLPREGLRDGHHRTALAALYGLTHVPAYVACDNS